MKSIVQPYLFFKGNCEEAIEYYCAHLGAKLQMMMRFNECPDPLPPGMLTPGYEEKVMHASFHIGESLIMASDGCGGEDQSGFSGFSLSLTVADEAEANRVFDLLANGGAVQMPLGKTFWSPCFGMANDRFGIGWMISVPGPETSST